MVILPKLLFFGEDGKASAPTEDFERIYYWLVPVEMLLLEFESDNGG